MAVKIKLTRLGKIRNAQYRVVIADSRTRRDGRAIETIGKYHPKEEPSLIDIDSERAQYWLSVGAQPTEPVEALLKITGDLEECLDGLGGLCAHGQPVLSALGIDVDQRGLFLGVVLADGLDRTAVTTGARVGDDNAVLSVADLAEAGELDFDSHSCSSPSARTTVLRMSRAIQRPTRFVSPVLPLSCDRRSGT